MLLALISYQLVTRTSNWLMLQMEKLKTAEIAGISTLAAKVQNWLVLLCENQETMSFGSNSVGQLFVCGYWVVEGGFIFQVAAVVVYAVPKIGDAHRAFPRLLKNCQMLLFFYSAGEAVFTVLKGLIMTQVEHHVYISELMMKKLAMLGVLMMFLQASEVMPARKKRAALDASPDEERPPLQEGLLLTGRLLMAGLFLFVGTVECSRVLWGKLHDPPDGHDVLWPKIVQLLLVLPFTFGFKTNTCTQLLAICLVLEAMTAWKFWNELYSDMPTMFHAIHSKDHFATNIAVAGGLFMLQEEGGGKYTLDAYMKKKD